MQRPTDHHATESASSARPLQRQAIGAMTFQKTANRLAFYVEPDRTITIYQSNASLDKVTLTRTEALQLVQDHAEHIRLLTLAIALTDPS